jgi:Tfp pilus assembly protein PilN
VRPVNLIPPEDQRGDRAPGRTGAVPYVLIGALAVGLVGVIAMAMTSKQISDREAQKQGLEQELQVATSRAEALRPFADFRAVQETRAATVSSLAQSRFDWERVMRELALVIPSDIWLLNLTGTVTPAVQVEDGAEIQIRDTVPGPALEMIGCAPDQDAVAGMIAALEDIDGVTRVGVASSSQSDEEVSAGVVAGAAEATSEDCRTRSFIYQFEIVVAFDAVPAPATASAAPSVPAPVTPAAEGAQPATAPASGSNSTSEQVGEAQQAANLVPGG